MLHEPWLAVVSWCSAEPAWRFVRIRFRSYCFLVPQKSCWGKKGHNKCRQNALTSERCVYMSGYRQQNGSYPCALLALQAWYIQYHCLGLQPSVLGPSPQEGCWRSGTVLGSGRSCHWFLGTQISQPVLKEQFTSKSNIHICPLTCRAIYQSRLF